MKERNKCERRRCQQYWDSSWTIGKDATEGNVIQHNLVRGYLQIENAVTIDYFKPYDRKSKRTKSNVYTSIQMEEDKEFTSPSPTHQIDDTNIPYIPESPPQRQPELINNIDKSIERETSDNTRLVSHSRMENDNTATPPTNE